MRSNRLNLIDDGLSSESFVKSRTATHILRCYPDLDCPDALLHVLIQLITHDFAARAGVVGVCMSN